MRKELTLAIQQDKLELSSLRRLQCQRALYVRIVEMSSWLKEVIRLGVHLVSRYIEKIISKSMNTVKNVEVVLIVEKILERDLKDVFLAVIRSLLLKGVVVIIQIGRKVEREISRDMYILELAQNQEGQVLHIRQNMSLFGSQLMAHFQKDI